MFKKTLFVLTLLAGCAQAPGGDAPAPSSDPTPVTSSVATAPAQSPAEPTGSADAAGAVRASFDTVHRLFEKAGPESFDLAEPISVYMIDRASFGAGAGADTIKDRGQRLFSLLQKGQVVGSVTVRQGEDGLWRAISFEESTNTARLLGLRANLLRARGVSGEVALVTSQETGEFFLYHHEQKAPFLTSIGKSDRLSPEPATAVLGRLAAAPLNAIAQ
jgi:hypothetical protein